MTLTEALDLLYGEGVNWHNPIRPYFVSGISQTPYEAFRQLKDDYQTLVRRWVGHEPRRDEDLEVKDE